MWPGGEAVLVRVEPVFLFILDVLRAFRRHLRIERLPNCSRCISYHLDARLVFEAASSALSSHH